LIITADKYLEPGLSAKADQHFREVALGVSDADVVFDIFRAIKTDMSHAEPLLAFVDVLRKKNLKKLLKIERYRDLLAGNKDFMLAQLDELEEKLEVSQTANKRHFSVCTAHAAQVFKSPGVPVLKRCPLCPEQTFHLFGQPRNLVRGIADVPPTAKPSW
jgi:hypothetical protein